MKTELLRTIACLASFVFAHAPLANADGRDVRALAGFELDGVTLGMPRDKFLDIFPDAVPGAQSDKLQQYIVLKNPNSSFLFEFRTDELARVTRAIANLDPSEQQSLTDEIFGEFRQNFGDFYRFETGKVKQGVVYPVSGAAFRASDSGIILMIESSSVELATSIIDEAKISVENAYVPIDKMKRMLRSFDRTNSDDGSFRDFLAHQLDEAKDQTQNTQQTAGASSQALPQPDASGSVSSAEQMGDQQASSDLSPEPPPASSTERSPLRATIVATAIIVAISAGTAIFFLRRKGL